MGFFADIFSLFNAHKGTVTNIGSDLPRVKLAINGFDVVVTRKQDAPLQTTAMLTGIKSPVTTGSFIEIRFRPNGSNPQYPRGDFTYTAKIAESLPSGQLAGALWHNVFVLPNGGFVGRLTLSEESVDVSGPATFRLGMPEHHAVSVIVDFYGAYGSTDRALIQSGPVPLSERPALKEAMRRPSPGCRL